MDIHIRAADFSTDLIALHALTTELGYSCARQQFNQRILNLHQDPHYYTWVASIADEVVGYSGMIRLRSWEVEGEFIRIQVLVTHSAFRGVGVATQLLKHVERWAAEHKIQQLLLNSGNRPEREIAHQFYLNYGFIKKTSGFNKLLDS